MSTSSLQTQQFTRNNPFMPVVFGMPESSCLEQSLSNLMGYLPCLKCANGHTWAGLGQGMLIPALARKTGYSKEHTDWILYCCCSESWSYIHFQRWRWWCPSPFYIVSYCLDCLVGRERSMLSPSLLCPEGFKLTPATFNKNVLTTNFKIPGSLFTSPVKVGHCAQRNWRVKGLKREKK